MNSHSLTRPALAFSLAILVAPVKQELLRPVPVPGQPVQQSPADQAVSLRHHQVGLLCQHLHSFEQLGDNWDGYGAVPPSTQALRNAMELLNGLAGEWVLRLHPDDLTPTPYGTITLEWATATDYVSVEVGDAQWACTAELAGELQSSPNAEYPNASLRQRVEQVLQALFPHAVPQDVPAYTA